MPHSSTAIKLFRDILKAHRALPPAHRKLGDSMVKQEFRQHQNATPNFLFQFERQWRDYLQQLRVQTLRGEPVGRALSDEDIMALSDEQRNALAQALDPSAPAADSSPLEGIYKPE